MLLEDVTRKEIMTTHTNDQPTYSVAEITYKDGSRLEFTVKASPSVVPHLIKDMKSTGYLTLWNDTETISIAADGIKHFALELTKE